MSEVRIPVSLKFNTDMDVYKDFIVDLRDNRELSPFIVAMLELYYEDDDVRDLINLKREENNPFSALKEQVAKINMQHTKTIVATSMLASQTQGIISGLEREGYVPSDGNTHIAQGDDSAFTMNIGDAPPQQHQQQQQQAPYHIAEPHQPSAPNTDDTVIATLMQRMDSMEKLLPNINEKLEQLLSGGMQVQQPTPQPVAQPQPIQQPMQEQPVVQAPVQSTPPPQPQPPAFESPVATPTTPPVIQVEQAPTVEAPTITLGEPTVEAPSISVGEPTIAQQGVEEPQETKPASFGKAFGSLKKKK